jgi:hypothetical protein
MAGISNKRPSARTAVLFLELPSKNRKAAVADPRRPFPVFKGQRARAIK